jgi:hypothetical protein
VIAIEDLKAARGLWTKTADYFEIGWDSSAQAYTIPIRDADNNLVNLRRYQIRPPEPVAGRSGASAVTMLRACTR